MFEKTSRGTILFVIFSFVFTGTCTCQIQESFSSQSQNVMPCNPEKRLSPVNEQINLDTAEPEQEQDPDFVEIYDGYKEKIQYLDDNTYIKTGIDTNNDCLILEKYENGKIIEKLVFNGTEVNEDNLVYSEQYTYDLDEDGLGTMTVLKNSSTDYIWGQWKEEHVFSLDEDGDKTHSVTVFARQYDSQEWRQIQSSEVYGEDNIPYNENAEVTVVKDDEFEKVTKIVKKIDHPIENSCYYKYVQMGSAELTITTTTTYYVTEYKTKREDGAVKSVTVEKADRTFLDFTRDRDYVLNETDKETTVYYANGTKSIEGSFSSSCSNGQGSNRTWTAFVNAAGVKTQKLTTSKRICFGPYAYMETRNYTSVYDCAGTFRHQRSDYKTKDNRTRTSGNGEIVNDVYSQQIYSANGYDSSSFSHTYGGSVSDGTRAVYTEYYDDGTKKSQRTETNAHSSQARISQSAEGTDSIKTMVKVEELRYDKEGNLRVKEIYNDEHKDISHYNENLKDNTRVLHGEGFDSNKTGVEHFEYDAEGNLIEEKSGASYSAYDRDNWNSADVYNTLNTGEQTLTRYAINNYGATPFYSSVYDAGGNLLKANYGSDIIYQFRTLQNPNGTSFTALQEFNFNDKYRSLYNPLTNNYMENLDSLTTYGIASMGQQSYLNQLDVSIQPNKVPDYQDLNRIQNSSQYMIFSGNQGERYVYDLRNATMYHEAGSYVQPLELVDSSQDWGVIYRNARDEYLQFKDKNLRLVDFDLK